jgi:Mo25-like
MAFLFNRSNRPKTPQDLVRSVRESIARLDVPSEKKRAIEEITKCLNSMKNILIGDGGKRYLQVCALMATRSRSHSGTSRVVVAGDLHIRSSASALVESLSIRIRGEEGFRIYFQHTVTETSRRSVSYSGVSCAEGGDITCPDKRVSLLEGII